MYVYTGKSLSEKVLSIILITFRNLRDVYSTQIQVILKLRIELYQKINAAVSGGDFEISFEFE